jgi:hypothetical protein
MNTWLLSTLGALWIRFAVANPIERRQTKLYNAICIKQINGIVIPVCHPQTTSIRPMAPAAENMMDSNNAPDPPHRSKRDNRR